MDLLTEILRSLHLRSTVLYRGCATAPWGVGFSPRKEGADACFHVVTEGSCLLQIDGEGEPVPLEAGDFVVLPYAHAHSLRDAHGTPVVPVEQTGALPDDTGTVRYGGGGAACTVVCGTFVFEGGATNPLLRALPTMIHVRGGRGEAVPWLEPTLAFIACEARSGRPGAETVIARLCDILFIQAVRGHLAEMAPEARGWLRAMADAEIGPVLQAVHREPSAPWTVAALADRANLSRSAFAARFSELMGEPPLQYVTRWRLHVAAGLLRDPQIPVSAVAERVGYESEAAFSKTFKRWMGVPPGSYRGRRSPVASPLP